MEKYALCAATGLILHPEPTLSALSRGRKLRTAIKSLRSVKKRKSPRRSNCLPVARGKNLVRSVGLRSTFVRKFAPVGIHLPRCSGCSGRTFAFFVFERIATCITCGLCPLLRTNRFQILVLSANPIFATNCNVFGKLDNSLSFFSSVMGSWSSRVISYDPIQTINIAAVGGRQADAVRDQALSFDGDQRISHAVSKSLLIQ